MTRAEILNEDGSMATNPFSTATGTAYIATALRAARAADPGAKLYVRFTGISRNLLHSSGVNRSTILTSKARERNPLV